MSDLDQEMRSRQSHILKDEGIDQLGQVTLLEHQTGEAMSSSSNVAGRSTNESCISSKVLQEVLGQSSGLKMRVVPNVDTPFS